MDYIKKIGIDRVEEFFRIDLKRNKTSLGFDVSKTKTGMAIVKTTNKYFYLLKTDTTDMPSFSGSCSEELEAVNIFLEQLLGFKEEIIGDYKLDIIRIENCYLQFGNAITLKALARYGILVFDEFRNLADDIDLEYPKTPRANINFKKRDKDRPVKEQVTEYINKGLDIEIENDNIIDAIGLAISGLVRKED